jgi:hypothetical protein
MSNHNYEPLSKCKEFIAVGSWQLPGCRLDPAVAGALICENLTIAMDNS